MPRDLVLLDGPVGTELAARGVPTRLPLWSASAVAEAPEVLSAIHADYAAAGATLHTACTFRTQPRWMGDDFEEAARRAVHIARGAVPAPHRIAGSVAPVEDCYRPDRSPGLASRVEHRALVRVLASAGVDVLLCETFPHPDEALVAVEEALATGLPTWLALTAGPDADLMTPATMRACAARAVALGAECVLVNCVPVLACAPYVDALAGFGVPFGVYANAGAPDDAFGWTSTPFEAERYADAMERFIDAGATVVGGCCGTGPAHIAALQRRYDSTSMS